MEFEGLHKQREPRSIDVLDPNVTENRLDVVLVSALIIVESSLFQLHRSVIFKVPLRKL